MGAFALLSAADAALRVASLNLCTDEYLLLLGRPAEIVSVSHLSRDPHESPLWRQARRYPANAGTLESVVARKPTIVLTMGGGGRATGAIARRMGIRILELPYPLSVREVGQQAAAVAAAIGDQSRAEPYLRQMTVLARSRPAVLQDAAFLSGGGLTLSPTSLGADWLRLAGLRQRASNDGRLSLEALATNPPRWLVRSDYRAGQVHQGTWWLRHPVVRRLGERTVGTDGRRWTCAGLPMIGEALKMRAKVR
ncbi:hypothetical protein ACFQPG_09725 [Sphingomonas sp. GCM10030256]|uniref:hypothetical protein n=1 Tax=Sphingomonas sp. GCM10030256 TaxID=3273427 RepID=UPI00360CA027